MRLPHLQGPPGMPMPPGALPARNLEKELESLLSKPTIRDRAKTEKCPKPLISFRPYVSWNVAIILTDSCKGHFPIPCLASASPAVHTLKIQPTFVISKISQPFLVLRHQLAGHPMPAEQRVLRTSMASAKCGGGA